MKADIVGKWDIPLITENRLTVGRMLQKAGYNTACIGKWHLRWQWHNAEEKPIITDYRLWESRGRTDTFSVWRWGGMKDSIAGDRNSEPAPSTSPGRRLKYGNLSWQMWPNPENPTELANADKVLAKWTAERAREVKSPLSDITVAYCHQGETTDPLYVYIENGMVDVPATVVHRRKNLPNLDGWLWDNDEGFMSVGYDFENADKIFYAKTVQFIEDHLKRYPDKPFFAVLSTQIAHAPVLPAEEFRGKTKGGPRGDFVWELDVLVGRLLDKLDELGVDENTIVLFNADNGAETVHYHRMRQEYNHDASGKWRGMKRDGWEGGHRVPFIARWPKAIPAGQVTKQMTNATDIFATLASVVGYQLKDEDATDSFDMLPVMLGIQDEDKPVRPHMLTQSFRGEFQIRKGQWKYLDHKSSGGNNYSRGYMAQYLLPEKEPAADGQLYHLGRDPGETTNLYFKETEKRKELQALLGKLKASGRSAPTGRKPVDIKNISVISGKAKNSIPG